MGRYVVADPATKVIVGGPYAWNGITQWTPNEIVDNPDAGYAITEEAIALDEGYTYPTPGDAGGGD